MTMVIKIIIMLIIIKEYKNNHGCMTISLRDVIFGWQQSHLVFFHDFRSKFINTNNKH